MERGGRDRRNEGVPHFPFNFHYSIFYNYFSAVNLLQFLIYKLNNIIHMYKKNQLSI